MSDPGPLQTWEIIWRSGHVERVQGHQCLWPMDLFLMEERGPKTLTIHGEIDGHWHLLLAADAKDVISVRRVVDVEATS